MGKGAAKQTSVSAGATDASSSKSAMHIVRVKVLGLAGVIVNNNDTPTSTSSGLLPPSQMKAAIVLTRDGRVVKNSNNGRAASNLSMPLCRSPNEIVSTRDDASSVGSVGKSGVSTMSRLSGRFSPATRSQQKDDKKRAVEVATGAASSSGRYLAVWDAAAVTQSTPVEGENKVVDETVLEFETNFTLTEKDVDDEQSLTSHTTVGLFAPKSFSVGIVLLPSVSGTDAGCAFPLGVASLAITGDDSAKCSGGGRVIDLPVLSADATRPVVGPHAAATATVDRGMVDLESGGKITSMKEMEKRLGTVFKGTPASTGTASKTYKGKKTKKKSLTSLLRRINRENKSKTDNSEALSVKSTARSQIEAFSDKYSIDATGDAVLRLCVQVYAKEPCEVDRLRLEAFQKKKAEMSGRSLSSGVNITVVTEEKAASEDGIGKATVAATVSPSKTSTSLPLTSPEQNITEGSVVDDRDRSSVTAICKNTTETDSRRGSSVIESPDQSPALAAINEKGGVEAENEDRALYVEEVPSDEANAAPSQEHDVAETEDKKIDSADADGSIVSYDADASTIGSTVGGDSYSRGTFETKSTNLTGETGTVTKDDTITTSIEMSPAGLQNLANEVMTMAREAKEEGQKTGKPIEAFVDTFILAGCRPVTQAEEQEAYATKPPGSDEARGANAVEGTASSKYARTSPSSDDQSPRGIDDLDEKPYQYSASSFVETITDVLNCRHNMCEAADKTKQKNGSRQVATKFDQEVMSPPREIAPQLSSQSSIGDLTDNTAEWFGGLGTHIRSKRYDKGMHDKYDVVVCEDDDLTLTREEV